MARDKDEGPLITEFTGPRTYCICGAEPALYLVISRPNGSEVGYLCADGTTTWDEESRMTFTTRGEAKATAERFGYVL
jgi:hypothetical protein